jgi:hypothetical protein
MVVEKVKGPKLTGSINVKIFSKDGKLKKELNLKNTDTFFAKLSTPPSSETYCDFIEKVPEDTITLDSTSWLKTLSNNLLSSIRSGRVASKATIDVNKKTLAFVVKYTNDSSNKVIFRGLVSWDASNGNSIYTITFFPEDALIELEQQDYLIANYVVTYNQPSSEILPNVSLTTSDIGGDNTVVACVAITPEVRKFKYTRTFIGLTSDIGVNPNETPLSVVKATVTSSDSVTRKALGPDSKFIGYLEC